jgi:hypothetical protein
MKQTTCKHLAELAMQQSKGYSSEGESTDVSTGALIYAYAEALTSWQDIEGVRLDRTPKPVKVDDTKKENWKWFDKMIAFSSTISDDETLMFDNTIILN